MSNTSLNTSGQLGPDDPADGGLGKLIAATVILVAVIVIGALVWYWLDRSRDFKAEPFLTENTSAPNSNDFEWSALEGTFKVPLDEVNVKSGRDELVGVHANLECKGDGPKLLIATELGSESRRPKVFREKGRYAIRIRVPAMRGEYRINSEPASNDSHKYVKGRWVSGSAEMLAVEHDIPLPIPFPKEKQIDLSHRVVVESEFPKDQEDLSQAEVAVVDRDLALNKESAIMSLLQGRQFGFDGTASDFTTLRPLLKNTGLRIVAVKESPPPTVTYQWEATEWTTPKYGFIKQSSKRTSTITVETPSTGNKVDIVSKLPDGFTDPSRFANDYRNDLLTRARNTTAAAIHKVFNSKERKSTFILYADLLPLLLIDGTEPKDLSHIDEILSGLTTERFIEIERDLRKFASASNFAADYHYTYAYCYVALDCVALLDLIQLRERLSEQLDTKFDNESMKSTCEKLRLTLFHLAFQVRRHVALSTENGTIRYLTSEHKERDGRYNDGDTSVGILAFYTLWKLSYDNAGHARAGGFDNYLNMTASDAKSALKNAKPEEIPILQEIALCGKEEVQAALERLAETVKKSADDARARETMNVNYTPNRILIPGTLFGGHVMSRSWVHFLAANGASEALVSELWTDEAEFRKRFEYSGSISQWHYYNMAYLSRALEVLARSSSLTSRFEPNNSLATLRPLLHVLVSNYENAVHKGDSSGYAEQYYIIGKYTMILTEEGLPQKLPR